MGNDEDKNCKIRTLKSEEECVRILKENHNFEYDSKNNDFIISKNGKNFYFGNGYKILCGQKIKVKEVNQLKNFEDFGVGEFYDCIGYTFYLPKSFFEDELKLKLDKVLEVYNEN
jgi:hypothetical protein